MWVFPMCVAVWLAIDMHSTILGGATLYLFCIAALIACYFLALMMTKKGKRLEYVGPYFMTYILATLFCILMLFKVTSEENYLKAEVINKIKVRIAHSNGRYAPLIELNIDNKENFEYRASLNKFDYHSTVFVYYETNVFGFKIITDVTKELKTSK